MNEGEHIPTIFRTIASSVDPGRKTLRRIRIKGKYAFATDSYRMVRMELPQRFRTGDRSLSHEAQTWGDEPIHVDLEYPKTGFIEEQALVVCDLSWDEEGTWRHGKARREFWQALVHWGFYDGQRRKPSGNVELRVTPEGVLQYRLGMMVNDETERGSGDRRGRVPKFFAMSETWHTPGVKLVGYEPPTEEATVEAGDEVKHAGQVPVARSLGLFNGAYLSDLIGSELGGIDRIGWDAEEGKITRRPLYVRGALGWEGWQMPILPPEWAET